MVDARGNPESTLFEADGLHLSPKGYALWQQEIGAQLAQMLLKNA
jgi:lysophospholipase L1-like esterase